MNKLIMDYLMIEGYRSAAEEFAREADIPSDQQPDFDGIASRMAVRDAVARGDVVEAIERVNDLNPEVSVHMRLLGAVLLRPCLPSLCARTTLHGNDYNNHAPLLDACVCEENYSPKLQSSK